MSLEAVRQDIRRQLGPRMDTDGAMDELIRRRDEIRSGRLTPREVADEQDAMAREAGRLADKLDGLGLFDLANTMLYQVEHTAGETMYERGLL